MTPGPGWSAALAHIHAAAFPAAEAWNASAIDTLLATPGMRVFAQADGFILLRQAADEAEIVTLAVLPHARRRGIGRALLSQAIEHARANGVTRLFLEVAQANAGAHALYGAAGFVAVGHRPRYYPDGGDAVLMGRPLL